LLICLITNENQKPTLKLQLKEKNFEDESNDVFWLNVQPKEGSEKKIQVNRSAGGKNKKV
jgi:hypothetical protein